MSTNTELPDWLHEDVIGQLANLHFRALPGADPAAAGSFGGGAPAGGGLPAAGGFGAGPVTGAGLPGGSGASPVTGASVPVAGLGVPVGEGLANTAGGSVPAAGGFGAAPVTGAGLPAGFGAAPVTGGGLPATAGGVPVGSWGVPGGGGSDLMGGVPALKGSAAPAIALPSAIPASTPTTDTGGLGAIGRQESFDIKDPQSSLPDPHFADGKVPASVAGSGRSPIRQNKGGGYSSVGAGEPAPSEPAQYPHEWDMRSIFSAIPSFTPSPQLPLPSAQDPGYYFLHSSNPWNQGKADIQSAPGLHAGINGLSGLTGQPFDVNAIRGDFPILQQHVNGRPLIWLDNAATTQKPQQVIDRISYFYQNENSNIHRAAHALAARATDAYEAARKKVQHFLHAGSVNEIVFVRGATEAINLVAKSWGEQYLHAGDEIIVSHLEHHANIVPWQQLVEKKGVKLRVIPVDDDGQVLLGEYAKLLNGRTKLVAITQVSNALGTITPVAQIVAMAHAAGARALVDGAQSVSHMPVDVRAIDADWFVLSGHKLFAPTGIGVLYGKEELLNATQPWQGGGNMIKDVTFEHTEFHAAPGRFEAGTGNIADAVGLGAAIDYISAIGMDRIGAYEHYLLEYATRLLKQVPGLRLIGTAAEKASVLSFVFDGFTNDEVGQALNKDGIAVRTGHHCAQPILRRFGLESTVRPSLAFYNTCGEVDALVSALYKLRRSK